MIRQIKSIGVFGSNFDPIHLGHLWLLEKVQQVMKFDEIRMVLTGSPPHKPHSTIATEDRWHMLCLACKSTNYLIPESFEKNRTELSYAIDTMEFLTKKNEATSFCWIMGSDAYYGLATWHRWKDLFDLCNFVIVDRPQKEKWIGGQMDDFFRKRLVKRIDTQGKGQILSLQLPMIAVSSSEIRQCIKRRGCFSQYLPKNVADYIDVRELYS